ncbi:F-box/kelch-repeat protein At1g51550 [Dioscorea cayenensis subsp. rotundata]|uniref:F-box/kelch-repeat protein At1g51550 n=1 Tax=Dioscorea cayennensis subsp. rotundata TaxID=55577 RepID=A0AB40CCQ0_DIOCR|nr:F-box/kelch-repeat protein At1g51550 [Dioscorea cayenensis subsp. rotundata]
MNPDAAEHHHLPLLRLASSKTKKQAFFMASAPNSNPDTTPSPPPPSLSPSSSLPSSSVTTASYCTPSITAMDYDHIVSILHLLPLDSILCFSMTCRKFRSLASSESLWELVCRRDWGSSSVDALVSSFSSVERREMSWKRLYQQVSQLSSVSCRRLVSKDGIFPRPRASHSLNYVSDCLVLFGGGCEGGRHLDDTWVAYIGNGFNRVLSWQQVDSSIPNGRFGHSCIIIADSLVLFGGINDSGVRHNDTWIGRLIREGPLDIKISWRPLDVGPVAPAPRGAHAACCTGEHKMVIHGGIGFNGLRLDDTWVLDLTDDLISARWYPITNARLSPPARSGHSLTWIGGCHMVLYGGRGSGYDVLNDVWLLDIGRELPEWMELKYDNSNIPSEMPLPRVGHSATLIIGGQVLIYGGEDSQRHRKNDFWILDVGALSRFQAMGLKRPPKIWKKLRLEGHCPSYRSFHGACTDRSGRNVFIFGGMVDGVVHPAEAYGLRFDGELYHVKLVLQL